MRGFVPLKLTDKTAWPYLWKYAEVRGKVDKEFEEDLKQALFLQGYKGGEASDKTKVIARLVRGFLKAEDDLRITDPEKALTMLCEQAIDDALPELVKISCELQDRNQELKATHQRQKEELDQLEKSIAGLLLHDEGQQATIDVLIDQQVETHFSSALNYGSEEGTVKVKKQLKADIIAALPEAVKNRLLADELRLKGIQILTERYDELEKEIAEKDKVLDKAITWMERFYEYVMHYDISISLDEDIQNHAKH